MDLILDLCITEVTESFANHLERRERGNLEKRENFENIPLILYFLKLIHIGIIIFVFWKSLFRISLLIRVAVQSGRFP